jgi:hypothetical protein
MAWLPQHERHAAAMRARGRSRTGAVLPEDLRPTQVAPDLHRHGNPLANSIPSCGLCGGWGARSNGTPCPCVSGRLNRERAALPGDWERLWLDSRRRPDLFPSRPVPGSSWGRRMARAPASLTVYRH